MRLITAENVISLQVTLHLSLRTFNIPHLILIENAHHSQKACCTV